MSDVRTSWGKIAFKAKTTLKKMEKHMGFTVCYLTLTSCNVQSNLNSSNIDGLLTKADSNSFSSPYEIFPIAQEK